MILTPPRIVNLPLLSQVREPIPDAHGTPPEVANVGPWQLLTPHSSTYPSPARLLNRARHCSTVAGH